MDYNDNVTGSIKMSRSLSSGVNWEAPTIAATGRYLNDAAHSTINGISRALTLPMARFNAYQSRVVVVWHERESSGSTATDVYYNSKGAPSPEFPTGWRTPTRINDDGIVGRDQFMPALDYDESGNMFVGFYDRREDPLNTSYKEYVANINIEGAPLRLNAASSSFSTNPTAFVPSGAFPNNFIGDYQQTFYSNYPDLQQWVSSYCGVGTGGLGDIWLAHIF